MTPQKYSGAGNKFFIINSLDDNITDYDKLVKKFIAEDESMDGVIFVEKSVLADFKMNYFNKDGSGNSLCGNGLRCTMQYILDNNFPASGELIIESVSENYECKKLADGQISVKFPPPKKFKTNFKLKVHFKDWWQLLNCSYVDCGSPHIVIFIDEIEKPVVKDLDEVEIIPWGRNIRMHKDLMPEGANVNFVKVSPGKNEIVIRSYERGVEGETLACGTGAISSALIFYILRHQVNPVKVLTKSGEYLSVLFDLEGIKLKSISLTGNAKRIH